MVTVGPTMPYAEGHVACPEEDPCRGATPRASLCRGQACLCRGSLALGILVDSYSVLFCRRAIWTTIMASQPVCLVLFLPIPTVLHLHCRPVGAMKCSAPPVYGRHAWTMCVLACIELLCLLADAYKTHDLWYRLGSS